MFICKTDSNSELECFNYILSTCVYLGRKPNYICDSYNSLLSTFLVYKFSNQHLYYIVSPFVGSRLTSPPHMEIQIRIQIIIFKPYVRELFRAIEKYSYIFMFIKNNKKTFISATQCYTVPWDIIGVYRLRYVLRAQILGQTARRKHSPR